MPILLSVSSPLLLPSHSVLSLPPKDIMHAYVRLGTHLRGMKVEPEEHLAQLPDRQLPPSGDINLLERGFETALPEAQLVEAAHQALTELYQQLLLVDLFVQHLFHKREGGKEGAREKGRGGGGRR